MLDLWVKEAGEHSLARKHVDEPCGRQRNDSTASSVTKLISRLSSILIISLLSTSGCEPRAGQGEFQVAVGENIFAEKIRRHELADSGGSAMYIQTIDSRFQHPALPIPTVPVWVDAHRSGHPLGDSALMRVAKRLGASIEGLRWHEDDISLLHEHFDAHRQIDYDTFAATFTHRFFLANYWKTAAALKDAGLQPPTTIVDLGSGSGAATAATLAWMHSTGPLPIRVHAILIDRSARQLAIARDLIANVTEVLSGLSVDISTLEATIGPQEPAWRLITAGADLVVASHLLTENIDQASGLVRTLTSSMASHAKLLVTERPDDEVWQSLPDGGRTIHFPNGGLPLNGFAGQRDPRRLSVRYCIVPTGKEKAILDLVDRYFTAWREQSVDQLAAVFAADATYQEKPFSEPIHTLQGIREYWIRRVLPQIDPQPQILKLVVDGGSAMVEWQTELTVGAEHKLVTGIMELGLDASGGRIGHLRECYSSRLLAN